MRKKLVDSFKMEKKTTAKMRKKNMTPSMKKRKKIKRVRKRTQKMKMGTISTKRRRTISSATYEM